MNVPPGLLPKFMQDRINQLPKIENEVIRPMMSVLKSPLENHGTALQFFPPFQESSQ